MKSKKYKYLSKETDKNITIITLNRPEVLNALNLELDRELKDAFTECGRDKNIRVIILRGNGPGFCAGHDFRDMQGEISLLEFRDIFEGVHQIAETMHRLDIPVIAAVHGAVSAGGCLIASASDVIVASEDAQFSIPGINVGLT
jgi:enoyl-CoA hydratase/carnithine racemase